MPATTGKIIVTPPAGLSVVVAITNEAGTTITTYTAENGSTTHDSPDTISTVTTYHLPQDGLYVLSVKYDGQEIAGRGGNTISSYVGGSQVWSVAPSIDAFEQDAAGSGAYLPHHFPVNAFGPPKAATNWSSYAALSGQWMGGVVESTGAQNAEITFPVTLAAGTWSLTLLHRKFTDRGIYTIYLDGSSVGTIDGYNGSAANGRDTLTGLTVAAGHQDVRLVMATQNASSSSYAGSISAVILTRTGD